MPISQSSPPTVSSRSTGRRRGSSLASGRSSDGGTAALPGIGRGARSDAFPVELLAAGAGCARRRCRGPGPIRPATRSRPDVPEPEGRRSCCGDVRASEASRCGTARPCPRPADGGAHPARRAGRRRDRFPMPRARPFDGPRRATCPRNRLPGDGRSRPREGRNGAARSRSAHIWSRSAPVGSALSIAPRAHR